MWRDQKRRIDSEWIVGRIQYVLGLLCVRKREKCQEIDREAQPSLRALYYYGGLHG